MCAALRPGRPPPSAPPVLRPGGAAPLKRRAAAPRGSGPAPALRIGRGDRYAAGALRAVPRSRPAGAARGDAERGRAGLSAGGERESSPGTRRVPPLRQRRGAGLCAAGTAPRSPGGRAARSAALAARTAPSLLSFLIFFFSSPPPISLSPSPPHYTRAVAPAGWPWQKNTSPHPKCTAARPGDECGRQQGARSAPGRAAAGEGGPRCGPGVPPPGAECRAPGRPGMSARRWSAEAAASRGRRGSSARRASEDAQLARGIRRRWWLREVARLSERVPSAAAAVESSAFRGGPERRGSAGEGRRCHRDVLCLWEPVGRCAGFFLEELFFSRLFSVLFSSPSWR